MVGKETPLSTANPSRRLWRLVSVVRHDSSPLPLFKTWIRAPATVGAGFFYFVDWNLDPIFSDNRMLAKLDEYFKDMDS